MKFSSQFIKKIKLTPNSVTTQIEPHDFIAEICDMFCRINTILIDFDRDIWLYVSRNLLKQKTKNGEIGSSTMPHKINPIDFENSEGNLGLANALLKHFAEKLPISRLQRDLSDSTVLRNLGVAFGYSLLGYVSAIKGLDKIEINKEATSAELNEHFEVLSEAIQTILRKVNFPNPYETLKKLTRGKKITQEDVKKFILGLPLSKTEKEKLLNLTPEKYIGLAEKIAILVD